MKTTKILCFEHGSVPEWTATLKAHLVSEVGDRLLFRHERQLPLPGTDAPVELRSELQTFAPDLLFLLLSPAGRGDSERLLREVQLNAPKLPVVVVTDTDEPRFVQKLFELGASDFLVPPLRAVEVCPRLSRLLQFREQQNTQLAQLRSQIGLEQLIGDSPLLLEEIRKIPLLAQCNASVLITGETGTGKELFARAVHYLSPRAHQPFVALNSGAIPVDLVENELFGHETGAYTNAHTAQPGVIREAEGGTLFLDEIDSLPPAAQVKLLRFLQDKEFRPLGARKTCRADVRVISACNAKLDEALAARRLREDLYYRLNVLRLHLPPLRDRRDNIPLLARHFLGQYATAFGRSACDLTPAALRRLTLYDWPGNVRELENVIERAVALSSGAAIQAGDIDVPVTDGNVVSPESFSQLKARVMAEFERGYVMQMLERHQGNIAHAARAAQKNRRAFFQLMRKHHIRVQQHPLAVSIQ